MATKKTVVKPVEVDEIPAGYVKIKLFKDQHRYKDDLTVGLNGKFYQIQRGKEVLVPEAVAEIIENSLAQQQIAANMCDELETQFEMKRSALE